MSEATAVAIINTTVALACAGLVAFLWLNGAGGWSFWGLVLLFGFTSSSKKNRP